MTGKENRTQLINKLKREKAFVSHRASTVPGLKKTIARIEQEYQTKISPKNRIVYNRFGDPIPASSADKGSFKSIAATKRFWDTYHKFLEYRPDLAQNVTSSKIQDKVEELMTENPKMGETSIFDNIERSLDEYINENQQFSDGEDFTVLI